MVLREYLIIFPRTLLLSCFVHLMSFMVSSVIDVQSLHLALNSIYFVRREIYNLGTLMLINNEVIKEYYPIETFFFLLLRKYPIETWFSKVNENYFFKINNFILAINVLFSWQKIKLDKLIRRSYFIYFNQIYREKGEGDGDPSIKVIHL